MLGTVIIARLGAGAVVPIDRRDGLELADRDAMRRSLDGCRTLIHLAALHPLVAPAGTDYEAANVVPFRTLLEVALDVGVRRVLLASSTSVWTDARPGLPCRFIDESTPPDAAGGYPASKLACEALLRQSGLASVVFRLARFARNDDTADAVRLLYRAVRPAAAAEAVARVVKDEQIEGLFALSGLTPFRPEDADQLAQDPRAVIRRRTGTDPVWVPDRIGSVIVTARAQRELGWRG